MIKRIFVISLLIALCICVPAYAASTTGTKARVASVSGAGIESVVAVADGSTAYTQAIDSTGSAQVSEFAELSSGVEGVTSASDVLILTGAGRIKTITANTVTTTSYLLVYDGTDTTGTLIADLQLVAADTQYTFPLNLDVGTGIYVDYSGNTGYVAYSVLYNSD